MLLQTSSRLLPNINTAVKLFLTGATVGPLIDTLHNQCLLEYTVLPIEVHFAFPANEVPPLIAFSASSSWLIPPLLGVSYVILGGFLPRFMQAVVQSSSSSSSGSIPVASGVGKRQQLHEPIRKKLSLTAIIAVLSTAMIIRLSEYLQTTYTASTNSEYATYNLMIMFVLALAQWMVLDRTPTALIAALITSVGGPLCELPFIASGCWHYIPSAAEYYPLDRIIEFLGQYYYYNTNDSSVLSNLPLSSITAPCYFAVTTDAIAFGRWFDYDNDGRQTNRKEIIK